MASKGESSTGFGQQLLANVVNPNIRITPSLFNGTNYKDWAYSARMAIGGSKRLGYIDGSIKEPEKEDPKYSDRVSENMLIMNWILNSMEEGISKSFKYFANAKGLRESIDAAYALERNNA